MPPSSVFFGLSCLVAIVLVPIPSLPCPTTATQRTLALRVSLSVATPPTPQPQDRGDSTLFLMPLVPSSLQTRGGSLLPTSADPVACFTCETEGQGTVFSPPTRQTSALVPPPLPFTPPTRQPSPQPKRPNFLACLPPSCPPPHTHEHILPSNSARVCHPSARTHVLLPFMLDVIHGYVHATIVRPSSRAHGLPFELDVVHACVKVVKLPNTGWATPRHPRIHRRAQRAPPCHGFYEDGSTCTTSLCHAVVWNPLWVISDEKKTIETLNFQMVHVRGRFAVPSLALSIPFTVLLTLGGTFSMPDHRNENRTLQSNCEWKERVHPTSLARDHMKSRTGASSRTAKD
ncbi:hypothetical protein BJV77DRAFT_963323 [Russula vinacea]|nr:hypothetical protein BJV77DRAFT_963323 [Russula vinacea]